MNVPRLKAIFSGIVFGVALAGVLGGVAFCSVSANDSEQDSTLNTHPLAGPNRPANVPDGYVITPFGYFHPSCVQSLAKGERQLVDGRIQRADGIVEAKAAVCSYPHFTHGGTPVKAGSAKADSAEAKTSPQINGWVEDGNISTGSAEKSYGALIATWTVPAQPSADDGELLYFFPGFEDGNNTLSILQPVLRWYGGQWAIASWNCCMNGVTSNSPYVNVTSGDEIYGSITSSCPPGTLSCATWNVLTLDMSTGESTTLGDTPSAGQAFGLAQGGVLEAYSVSTCDDYPSDGQISFEKIVVFDQDLKPVANPKWVDNTFETVYPYQPQTTPQCGYGMKGTRNKVTLTY